MDPVFATVTLISLASAVMVVTRRNPVYSAVWMLVCFLSFAVVFIKLSAAFLAAIHVLVYTGAILVLFLFVIMLLNLQPDELGEEHPPKVKMAAAALCLALFVFLAVPIARDPTMAGALPEVGAQVGSIESVGMLLFTTYALPFELVSVLIIVAMFGSLVLAKRDLRHQKAEERVDVGLMISTLQATHPYDPDPGPIERRPEPTLDRGVSE